MIKDTAGNVVFTITLKNSGNKPATEIGVTLNGESRITISDVTSSNPLQPGRSTVLTLTTAAGTLTQTYIAGNTYTVTIDATFTDGSKFTSSMTVQCRAA
jgi:hypothetical protein